MAKKNLLFSSEPINVLIDLISDEKMAISTPILVVYMLVSPQQGARVLVLPDDRPRSA